MWDLDIHCGEAAPLAETDPYDQNRYRAVFSILSEVGGTSLGTFKGKVDFRGYKCPRGAGTAKVVFEPWWPFILQRE